jgi:hypothetical protein
MDVYQVVEDYDNYDEEIEQYESPSFRRYLSRAKKIQERFPNRFLCGGLALKLYGVIERETFGDIDFVAFEKNVKDNEYISLKCKTPHTHCLFLGNYIKKGDMIKGIRLQNLDQIIHWKTQFGRNKDMDDLKKYLDSQYFKEEEFLINL